MEENIGIRLAQNLRDDLIFDLFAKDDIKLDLAIIKEEPIKREFKRLWVSYFCALIQDVDRTADRNKVKEEVKNQADQFFNFVQKLGRYNYFMLVSKYISNPLSFYAGYKIEDSDLEI